MYYVTIQSDPKYRLNTESLNNVFVRTNGGENGSPWASSWICKGYTAPKC